MATGPELLMNAMFKASGINPAEIVANVQAQIKAGVVAMEQADAKLLMIYNLSVLTNARLSRIEADQRRIMAMLNICVETDDETSGQLTLTIESHTNGRS